MRSAIVTCIAVFALFLATASHVANAWDVLGDLTNPGRILRNIEREMRRAAEEAARLDLERRVQQAAPAMQLWLEQSKASTGAALQIPSAIRSQLDTFYDAEILDSVRFKIGEVGDFNAANLSIKYGGAYAVTLINVIVFRSQTDADNAGLWAHELRHVEQFRDWGVRDFCIRYLRNYQAVEEEAYERQRVFPLWSSGRALQPRYPTAGTDYYIRSNVSGLFLDVYGASKNVGGHIVQALPHPTQVWQLVASASYPGYYHIRSTMSGLFLDVYGGSTTVGGMIVQANQHPSQVWKLEPSDQPGHFYIQSRVSGLYLDVHGGNKRVGTPIVQAVKHRNQVWSFSKVD